MAGQLGRALVAEFIGTLGFTFFGTMAIAWSPDSLLAVAFAHGIALALLVTACMPSSGGHLNPAVTIGFIVTGRIKPGDGIGFIISQLAGAVVGAFACYAVMGGGAKGVDAVVGGTFAVQTGATVATALIAETIATFFLMYMIFGTAVDPRSKERPVGGFAIGLTLVVDVLAVGKISGASMNPARMFGPTVVASLVGATQNVWLNNWIYWVGPIVGAAIASIVYALVLYPRAEPVK
jgi:MIP family channel proteins